MNSIRTANPNFADLLCHLELGLHAQTTDPKTQSTDTFSAEKNFCKPKHFSIVQSHISTIGCLCRKGR